MEYNFFYSKTINGETHLKMLSDKDESLTKGYEEITMKDYMEAMTKYKSLNLKLKLK